MCVLVESSQRPVLAQGAAAGAGERSPRHLRLTGSIRAAIAEAPPNASVRGYVGGIVPGRWSALRASYVDFRPAKAPGRVEFWHHAVVEESLVLRTSKTPAAVGQSHQSQELSGVL